MRNSTLLLSCEFFPPRTPDAAARLRAAHRELLALCPSFFSVTFGAGGSTQGQTFETVLDLSRAGSEAAPHLSCIGATREGIGALLDGYRDHGITRIVALRGDPPSGWAGSFGEFSYASELVSFIRERTGKHFHIEVAAYPEVHPQSRTVADELEFFHRKVDAGANGAITQYFYNADAYFFFLEACTRRGIKIPIVPGIMPISNGVQLMRFSDTCGAEIPRWLRRRLQELEGDKAGLQAFGLDVVTRLCERLLQGGAPGLHFYTLNQATPTLEISSRLGLLGR